MRCFEVEIRCHSYFKFQVDSIVSKFVECVRRAIFPVRDIKVEITNGDRGEFTVSFEGVVLFEREREREGDQVELFGLPDPERLAVELLRRLPPETDFERRWCETRRALEQAEAVTSKRSLHEHYWKVALREADGDEEHAAWLVERAITDDEFAAAETAEQALPLRRERYGSHVIFRCGEEGDAKHPIDLKLWLAAVARGTKFVRSGADFELLYRGRAYPIACDESTEQALRRLVERNARWPWIERSKTALTVSWTEHQGDSPYVSVYTKLIIRVDLAKGTGSAEYEIDAS